MKTKQFLFLFLLLIFPLMTHATPPKTEVAQESYSAKLTDTYSLKNEFKSETRFGFIYTTGNTDSVSFNGKNKTLYRINRFENTWKLGAYFYKVFKSTSTSFTETLSNYIYGTYRLDYYLFDRMTVYAGGGGYTDVLKGINTAGQFFTGLTYLLIHTEKIKLRTEAGYEFTYEDRISPNKNTDVHSLTTGASFKYQIRDNLSIYNELAMQENVEELEDFRIQNEIGLKVDINKTFSIIISLLIRLDMQPVSGFKKLDTITDFALAIQF